MKKYRETQANTTEDANIKAENARLKKQVNVLMVENLFLKKQRPSSPRSHK
ncbi:MAG: hypothetical protein Q4A82_01665 [Corynebacterium sp.]|nr:hypothetical protein [Corynebacterium sp.]